MAPKRKSSSNKKRRPKIDKATTPNLTPDASPSKASNPINHSPSTTPTPLDHSTSSTPTKHPTTHVSPKGNSLHLDQPPRSLITASNRSHHAPDYQNIKPIHLPYLPESVSSHAHVDPSSPPTQPSHQLLASNPRSEDQPAESSDQSGPPAKSADNKPSAKQAPAVSRVQDSGGSAENSADPITHSKHESRKAPDQLNKPNGSNHSVEKHSTQRQRPADRVLKEIVDHSNPLNGSSKPLDEKSDSTPLKSSKDSPNPASHHTNPVKKPAKHVKFTKNVKNDPSLLTSNQENHSSEHSDPHPANHEPEKESGSKNKPVAIRREMSGAADQFDFDAQQRQHAGPGRGMVKKPRHSHANSIHSVGSNSDLAEPNQVPSDFSPGDSHDEPNHPNKRNKGFQHAQRCLKSVVQTQQLDQPTEHDPDLLQIYLSYFDQNEDGLLDPLDTWRAFRRLRFGLILATLATITLHAMMLPFIGVGSGMKPDAWGLCHLPIGHHLFESTCNFFNITATSLSRYVSIDHRDHHYPENIGPSTLWKETRKHFGVYQMTDPIGWLRVVSGWIVAIALTCPSDLTVKSDLVNGVYNGEVLFLVAQDSSS